MFCDEVQGKILLMNKEYQIQGQVCCPTSDVGTL